jgi:hypothetical protein
LQCIYLFCTILRTIKRWNKVVTVHIVKAYTGSRGTAPLILNLSTRRWLVNFTPRRHYPRGKNPSMHWIGGWVGPTAGLDVSKSKLNLGLSNP